jgi:hypothetical protein
MNRRKERESVNLSFALNIWWNLNILREGREFSLTLGLRPEYFELDSPPS